MNCEDIPPPLEEDNFEEPEDLDTESDDEHEIECDDEGELTNCLFCSNIFKNVDTAMKHICLDHNISFIEMKAKYNMDQYSFIKLINCIRRDHISAQTLANATRCFWEEEHYLKPQEYEPWLSYDFEQLPPPANRIANGEDEITLLQEKLLVLQQKLQDQNEDMEKMRQAFQRLLANEETAAIKPLLQKDESYFNSYAHFSIHHEMLSDVVRTTSYRDALLKNTAFVSGKDVLDVGCGTAVLSIFASLSGAKSVVGIDNSDIIYNAMDIVKKNHVKNVNLIKGRLEDTQLPVEKYDIIVSEWMGYFLLFEGMLDSIIYARNNHLKDGGIILPNRCSMSLIGYGNDELYKKYVGFWNDVYGLNMTSMRKEVLHEPLIEIVDPKHIITEANIIADLNLLTVDMNYSNFNFNFNLKCTKDGTLSSFVGYFDTFFDLEQPVMFSTGPTDEPTHWKQVVFFIEPPQQIKTGDVVNGIITCKRSRSNARSLDLTIEVFSKKYIYFLD